MRQIWVDVKTNPRIGPAYSSAPTSKKHPAPNTCWNCIYPYIASYKELNSYVKIDSGPENFDKFFSKVETTLCLEYQRFIRVKRKSTSPAYWTNYFLCCTKNPRLCDL